MEKIQDTASRMLYENDQSLEGISSEQKKLVDGITSHTEDIEALHTCLSENGNKADQDVYGKAASVTDKVNKLMQEHLLKEDEDIQSINTFDDFIDAIKNAADYMKLKPPKVAKEAPTKQEEEEEKKEIEDINESED